MTTPLNTIPKEVLAITKVEISKVMSDHPDLSAYGWKFKRGSEQWNYGASFEKNRKRMLTDNFMEQVVTAKAFIKSRCSSRINARKEDSDYLKQKAERFGRFNGLASYVSNGAFITAAIILERKITPEWNSPKCFVGISPLKKKMALDDQIEQELSQGLQEIRREARELLRRQEDLRLEEQETCRRKQELHREWGRLRQKKQDLEDCIVAEARGGQKK